MNFLCLAMAFALVLMLGASRWSLAEIKTETVEYKHGDTTLKGFLAYDDASKGKRPAVIVVHEWWGLNDYVKRRATEVAKLGYVAFAPDMFGDGKTTSDPNEAGRLAGSVKGDVKIELARAQAAYDLIKSQPLVDPDRIAATGYCFGGSIALDMARAGMPIVGVVSFHGALKTQIPAQPEKLKAHILALHGADDPMVPPEEVQGFEDEMRKAKADWQFVAYGNAVHGFTNPEADQRNIPGLAYNEAADRRSWEAMKDFLVEVFR